MSCGVGLMITICFCCLFIHSMLDNKKVKRFFKSRLRSACFWFFRKLPLQDKVVATTMRGRKFGDNSKAIVEAVHRQSPETEIVWLKQKSFNYTLPNWVRGVDYFSMFRSYYELATAKVWVSTHLFESDWKKRKGQLVVQTWHGGLGIKKIEYDITSEQYRLDETSRAKVAHTCALSDVFISQSDFLSEIYRRAFGYQGAIWKCGYPKSDVLFQDNSRAVEKLKTKLHVDTKFLLYAPTFRQEWGEIDWTPFSVDFERLRKTLTKTYGGEWTILQKWHPVLIPELKGRAVPEGIIDVTEYVDMQELIMASDILISDYSSCMFDAALREIPCFIYATDFEQYKSERGVYYEMEELPFPYARNNDELMKNIESFDYEDYKKKWAAFKSLTGLYETGHASEDIAEKIVEFINGERVIWHE